MSEQPRLRELGDALEGALREEAAAEHYHRSQRQPRSARVGEGEGPRPLEFDRNGFPLPQPTPSFVLRVARLRKP
jgi:hypothetical protein